MYSCIVLDDDHVVCGCRDGSIHVWNWHNGECMRRMEGHDDDVCGLCIVNEDHIMSGSVDGSIGVWQWREGVCKRNIQNAHNGKGVNCCTSLRGGEGRGVSGGWDHTLRIWDMSNGTCIRVLEGHTNGVNCCSMLNDYILISGSNDDTIRIWLLHDIPPPTTNDDNDE